MTFELSLLIMVIADCSYMVKDYTSSKCHPLTLVKFGLRLGLELTTLNFELTFNYSVTSDLTVCFRQLSAVLMFYCITFLFDETEERHCQFSFDFVHNVKLSAVSAVAQLTNYPRA